MQTKKRDPRKQRDPRRDLEKQLRACLERVSQLELRVRQLEQRRQPIEAMGEEFGFEDERTARLRMEGG